METSALTAIESAMLNRPALDKDEIKDIFEFLIGRSARIVTDSELETAFRDALKEWQR